MPYRCAVFGCSNVADSLKSISLHKIHFKSDQQPDAKKRRRQWLQFVNTKTHKRRTHMCALHNFKPEDSPTSFSPPIIAIMYIIFQFIQVSLFPHISACVFTYPFINPFYESDGNRGPTRARG